MVLLVWGGRWGWGGGGVRKMYCIEGYDKVGWSVYCVLY